MTKLSPPFRLGLDEASRRPVGTIAAIAIVLPLALACSRPAFCGTVITDGSLGAARTLAGPKFSIPASLGQIRGGNLFQSLQTVNLSPGDSATFSGPSTVTSVIARVTGGSASSIDGMLACSIPNASFYLINPSGVIFGPNAALETSGNFAVTTADEVKLADGHVFAKPAATDATLTSASPAAFGFLGRHPASVIVNGSLLQVVSGHSITVAAGPLALSDAATLRAPDGKIGVLSVAGPATATLDPGAAPVVPAGAALADVSLKGESELKTTGIGGGRIGVTANNLTLDDSGLDAQTEGGEDGLGVYLQLSGALNNSGGFVCTSNYGKGHGGNIDIQATEIDSDLGTISVNTGIVAKVLNGSTANGGNITIDTCSVTLTQAQEISTSTYGPGHGGDISIVANHLTLNGAGSTLQNDTGVFARSYGPGDGGFIAIHAGKLLMTNEAAIDSSSYMSGPGGNIGIVASEFSLNGAGLSSTQSMGVFAASYGIGDGGGIDVHATHLLLTNNAAINGSSDGSGRAGVVSIDTEFASLTAGGSILNSAAGSGDAGGITVVAGQLDIDGRANDLGTGIYSEAVTGSTGSAGSVSVRATSVSVVAAGAIASDTYASGRAGDVSIVANQLKLDGRGSDGSTYVSSDADAGSGGAAGSVRIHAHDLSVLDSADVSSDAYSTGHGGNVSVTADAIRVSGTDSHGNIAFISSDADAGSSGAAGSIAVKTELLTLSEDGDISTTADGQGNGGDVAVTAISANLASGGVISSSTYGPGNAGKVSLRSNQLAIDGGDTGLSTGVFSEATATNGGAAGSIFIQTNSASLVGGGEINSDTYGPGRAGNVSLDANQLSINGKGTSSITGIISAADAGSSGPAGSILIHSVSASLAAGGFIESDSSGSGNGGNVEVVADTLNISGVDGKDAAVAASSEGSGNAGTVKVHAGAVNLTHGGYMTCSSNGSGNGGGVSVHARTLTIDGEDDPADPPGLFSATDGSGEAGQIIAAISGDLTMRHGATINTQAEHNAGGDVTISAGRLQLQRSSITTSSARFGGDIRINAQSLLFSRASDITAASEGTAKGDNGGDISIGPTLLSFLPAVQPGAISANAGRTGAGFGGDITVAPGGRVLASLGVDAEDEFTATGSKPGTIKVESPEVDLTGEVTPLVPVIVENNLSLAPVCQMEVGADQSSFTLEGGNGLPLDPADMSPGLPEPAAGPLAPKLTRQPFKQ